MLSHKLMGAAKSVAAITYVGGTTAAINATNSTTTNVSLTSLTGGIASQPSADDLVVVYYGTGSTADRAISVTTSGYTQIAKLYANDNTDTNLYVGYKVMGATPDTQVTVSATLSSQDGGAVAIHVWRNVDTILSLDVTSTTAAGTNSVLCDPPAITPNTAGSIILAGGAGGHGRGASQTYSSSNLFNFITIGGPDATNDVTVGLGSYAWTSGAFDPAAFTFSGSDSTAYSHAAVTLALRPKYTGTVPIYKAVSNTQAAATTSLTINKPTGTVDGDLMIAIMCSDCGPTPGTWTGPSGWTEVGDSGVSPSIAVYYKVASSEGASYTFTSSVNQQQQGAIITYSSAAYDTIGSFASAGATSTSVSVTGPSASTSFCILLSIGSSRSDSTLSFSSTGNTVRVNIDGTNPGLYVVDRYVISGATGTQTLTCASQNYIQAVMMTIKPT